MKKHGFGVFVSSEWHILYRTKGKDQIEVECLELLTDKKYRALGFDIGHAIHNAIGKSLSGLKRIV